MANEELGIVKVGPFTDGMNNVSPDHDLPATAVRSLVNADVTNSGTLKRRKGFHSTIAGTDITAAWSDGTYGYIADNGTLYRTYPDVDGELTAEAIDNSVGASLSHNVAFTKTATHTVLSDSLNLYYIDGLTLYSYNIQPPQLISTSGGSDGEFLIGFTTILDDGSESAMSPLTRVAGSYPLTVTATTNGRTSYLYASGMNGMELFRIGEITDGTCTVHTGNMDGMLMMNSILSYIPAGSMLRHGHGRLWSVVQGKYLFFSEPYYFNLYDPRKNVVPFEETLAAVEILDESVFIATEKYIGVLDGTDPSAMNFRVILPYGAIANTAVPDRNDGYMFMTQYGMHHVSLSGQITPLHMDKIAVESASTGASAILTQDGITRVVTSLYNGEFSGTVATSFMEAEIIRKEIVV